MEWISVKDKWPSIEIPFLATDGKYQHVVRFERDCERFVSGSGEHCYYCGGLGSVSYEGDPFVHPRVPAIWNFTHWMTLPKLPEKLNGMDKC
jgi:hypothetical protein